MDERIRQLEEKVALLERVIRKRREVMTCSTPEMALAAAQVMIGQLDSLCEAMQEQMFRAEQLKADERKLKCD